MLHVSLDDPFVIALLVSSDIYVQFGWSRLIVDLCIYLLYTIYLKVLMKEGSQLYRHLIVLVILAKLKLNFMAGVHGFTIYYLAWLQEQSKGCFKTRLVEYYFMEKDKRTFAMHKITIHSIQFSHK